VGFLLRKEWLIAKALGLYPFIENKDRRDPLKEAKQDRRNALLNKVILEPSPLHLKEGTRLGEELGGQTPSFRV